MTMCTPGAALHMPVTLVLQAHIDTLCWAGSKSSWLHLKPCSSFSTGIYLPLSAQKYHSPAALPAARRRDNRPNFYTMSVPHLLRRAIPILKRGQLCPLVGKLVLLTGMCPAAVLCSC